jgi:hypothetical protein
MMLEVIRHTETQTKEHLDKAPLRDIKRVDGKVHLLFRVAEVAMEEREETIREVLMHNRLSHSLALC